MHVELGGFLRVARILALSHVSLGVTVAFLAITNGAHYQVQQPGDPDISGALLFVGAVFALLSAGLVLCVLFLSTSGTAHAGLIGVELLYGLFAFIFFPYFGVVVAATSALVVLLALLPGARRVEILPGPVPPRAGLTSPRSLTG